MNRKSLTLLIVAALILLIFLLVVFTLLSKKNNTAATTNTPITPANISPTVFLSNGTYITPVITGADALMVTKVLPPNTATKIPTNTKITVAFNKPFIQDSIIFTIAPAVPFTLSSEDTVLTVTFNKPLAAGTTYTYKVDPKETFPHTYTFTTAGPAAPQANTYPEGSAQLEDEFNRSNNPDVFVANRTPHEEPTFSIDKKYNEGTRKFDFVVTVKGDDKTKAADDVATWFTSIGLSTDATSKLVITYQ